MTTQYQYKMSFHFQDAFHFQDVLHLIPLKRMSSYFYSLFNYFGFFFFILKPIWFRLIEWHMLSYPHIRLPLLFLHSAQIHFVQHPLFLTPYRNKHKMSLAWSCSASRLILLFYLFQFRRCSAPALSYFICMWLTLVKWAVKQNGHPFSLLDLQIFSSVFHARIMPCSIFVLFKIDLK